MKRRFLAVLLFACIVSVAQADFYIIIIANLGITKDAFDPGDGGQPDGPPPGGGAKGGVIGGGGNPPAGEKNESHLIVTAVVEVKSVRKVDHPLHPGDQNIKVYEITHRQGKTYFLPSDTIKLIQWTGPDQKPMPGVAARFQARHTDVFKVKKPPVEEVIKLAEWALGHGLTDRCAEMMKKAAEIDANHPAVVAFQKVEADLAKGPEKDDANKWKDKLLENYRINRSAHYALLNTAQADDNPEVRARLARLEDSFRAFYYWFALKRKALPMPDHRLVAVLAGREDDFWRQHRIFDAPVRVADGFFAQRENLLVFSGISLDQGHRAMLDSNKELFATFNPEQVWRGTIKQPNLSALSEEEAKKWINQAYEASTKAAFLKVLEMDSERATVSHDATRQLVSAAGLLPRNVATPEWIQFGMGSFFETAKGSPWGGVGVPSPTFNDTFNYLLQYRKMLTADRKLDKAALLRSVITDKFFRDATAKKDGVMLLKARSTSWALTFFLAHNRLDDLLNYYKELARLPRDLEFDDDVLLNCFGRAFSLMDPKQPNRIDAARFNRLASDWNDFITGTPLEADEMLKQIQKNQGELKGNP